MTRNKLFALTTILLVCMGALFVWQWQAVRALKIDNARLKDLAEQVDKLAEENARLQKPQMDPGELERLRREQSELLKLRNEVAQLRKQLKEAAKAQAAMALKPENVNTNESESSPVQTYSADVRAAVAPKQTLIAGGWSTEPGKHTFALVTPEFIEISQPTPGETPQVALQARWIEVKDEALEALGLDGVVANGKQSNRQQVISAEDLTALLKTMEQTSGVDVLSAPRMTILAGRQGEVTVTQPKEINGVIHETGPSMMLEPRLSSDGKSFDLSLTAKLRHVAASNF